MPQFLLDTNVCILLLRGNPTVQLRLQEAGAENCFISEITIAELYFGAEKSMRAAQEFERTTAFADSAQVLSITPALRGYARQRWRLQQLGQPLDDFDLLIGTTALAHNMIIVTNNTRHFARIKGLPLEDWTVLPLSSEGAA